MTSPIFNDNEFPSRHIGVQTEELQSMLATIGVRSLDQLIDETVPSSIRRKRPLNLSDGLSEYRYIRQLRAIAAKNKVVSSYLGQGYSNCIVPPVIQRNILENPGWYTQYTPYQPEVAQGRLEALLNFQTMVVDLTGMGVANASLLDEATAAAEAMTMAHGIANKSSNGHSADKIFVSERCYAQTIDVVRTRAEAVGIQVVVGNHASTTLDKTCFAALLQYPDEHGRVADYRSFIKQTHDVGGLTIVATDLLSLALLTPPGEFGADIVVGNSQRFGVPLGYGGPHAAFFATKSEFVRSMPGRIIGVSIDAHGNRAYRMTLQTREQHIRREKATSNICTAQALLAIMAGMYAAYHGPAGIKRIARRVHACTRLFELEAKKVGLVQQNGAFFDALAFPTGAHTPRYIGAALEAGYNIRKIDEQRVGVSFDETTTLDDLARLLGAFANVAGKTFDERAFKQSAENVDGEVSPNFRRASAFMTHPVFNSYHSESEMMRYIKSLENKDLSLTHSMIPLGSCTMKLNAAAELMPVSWPEFNSLHPFVPGDQAAGYTEIFRELEQSLCEITGFAACSLQPNSGAQGEFTGLLVIRAYHHDRGDTNRKVALIPSSAHGTNPASAVMAGMNVVVVNCDAKGNIDVDDLRAKAELHKEKLSCLIVTYPSTHGVYEERIQEMCTIVHQFGGQVYMDGANLNAQVGLTSPAEIGADVCHINLHKTFAIPHGGGGPGMGPICVANHLAAYLPGHPVVKSGGEKAIRAVSAAPYASSSILLISYAYIKMLGAAGVVDATRYAILNANYLKAKLEKHFPVLYQGKNGRVAHEFILNMKEFKEKAGVEVEDIAKRLIDYGFHAPTVSFPVAGTLMIEPTESESKAELDRFADALIAIRGEIVEIAEGRADRNDNVLKNAPHTANTVSADSWLHPYSRQKAAFPLSFVKARKFWPSVGRINSTYGDRNIVCSCPPIESYAEAASTTDAGR